MAVVHLRIGNWEYDVACDDGQEEHLRYLADEVGDRVQSLVYSMGNPGEPMALLMTAITMADELLEAKRENESVLAELRRLGQDRSIMPEERLAELESAMAQTLEEVAARIEKIADRVEVG